MTIRRGGGARDDRSQAHRLEDEHYAVPPEPPDRGRPVRPDPRSVYGQRRGHGLGGLLRFLVFLLVLASIVLVLLATVLRPVLASAVLNWAYDNPGALRLPLVSELVRENLGAALTDAPSADPTEVEFIVNGGDTPASLAPRLRAEGFVTDERAFIYRATERELAGQLLSGTFTLRRNMTPDQLVTGLIENRVVIVVLPVTFREGLRLEQLTAKLQTLGTPSTIDAQAFYDEVKHPPAALLEAHPWLAKVLPEGASLEGFLAPATYRITSKTTADDLVQEMLQAFHDRVGEERMTVAAERGLSFYEVVVLASIVEREAVLDSERPTIAGVYQNRLDPKQWRTGLLQADPTVIYGYDTTQLADYSEDWQRYTFWTVPQIGGMSSIEFPEALAGYQSYRTKGLPPGPICTPTLASIDAALAPSTKDGYFFFLAIPEGNGAHAFAKTQKEHDANRKKYGYLR